MAPAQHLLLPFLIISSSLLVSAAHKILPRPPILEDTIPPRPATLEDAILPRPPALNPSTLKKVNSICSLTDYKIVCVTSATIFAATYEVITPEHVLEMHIRLATDRLQAAKETAEGMVNDTEGKKQGAIKDCAGLYDSMLDCFAAAQKAVKEGDWGTASSNLSSVFSLSTSCDSSFQEGKEINPLEKKTKFLMKITSNALAILSNLRSQGSV